MPLLVLATIAIASLATSAAAQSLELARPNIAVTGSGVNTNSSNQRLETNLEVYQQAQGEVDRLQDEGIGWLKGEIEALKGRVTQNETDIQNLYNIINNLDLVCQLDQKQIVGACGPCSTAGQRAVACPSGYSASVSAMGCGSSGSESYCIPSTTCTAMLCKIQK